MEMINLLPPGLYEAVITEVDENTENPELVHGKYLFRLEPRTLGSIRELGENPPEDERRFATVARLSEANKSLYRTFAAPIVRMVFQEPVARALRQLHPHRLRFSMLSDRNPFLWPVKALAPAVRSARRPVAPDNPLLTLEKAVSSWIVSSLDAWGALRDRASEATFLGVYGLPFVQAVAGLGPGTTLHRHIERDLSRELAEQRSRSELETRYSSGGPFEAVIRGLAYVAIGEGSVDERGFSMLMAIRDECPAEERRSLTELKELLKDQYFLVRQDEERALKTLPALLPRSVEKRRAALDVLRRMVAARGTLSDRGSRRLHEVEALFDTRSDRPAPEQTAHA